MIYESDSFFWMIKTVMITFGTLGMMSSLTVFRYPIKKVLSLFGIYLLWVLLSSALLIHILGLNGIMRAFPITISAPAVFLAYKVDQDSPSQSVFNYATQISFSLVLTMVAVLLNLSFGGGRVSELLLQVVIYCVVIFLEYLFLRHPFRQLTNVIQTGWGTLSLIPFFFSLLLTLVGTVPNHYIYNPTHILYVFAILITMLVVYYAILQSLRQQYCFQLVAHDKETLQVQIAAMSQQADTIFAAEQKLQILRHDVRHFAEMMKANLQQGSLSEAQSVLSAFEHALVATHSKAYCTNHSLNAILTSYFEKAEKEGIAVTVNFTAPPDGSVDFTAFAVALANALENALAACLQAKSQPSITLKSRLFHGQFLMELSNTCDAIVLFDKDGIPLSNQGIGHGIGTRSILAFAKENQAFVSFRLEEERFILQMRFDVTEPKIFAS